MVCVRQTHSSPVSTADLKMHLEDLGNILFEDGTGLSPVHRQNREGKNKVHLSTFLFTFVFVHVFCLHNEVFLFHLVYNNTRPKEIWHEICGGCRKVIVR